MKISLAIILTILTLQLQAQEITGMVLDEKKQPMPGAVVQIFQDGVLKGRDQTDFDGHYVIKPLDAGHYELLVTMPFYDSILVKEIMVLYNENTHQNLVMAPAENSPREIVLHYKRPLVSLDNNPSQKIYPRVDLRNICQLGGDPTSIAPGIYQQKRSPAVKVAVPIDNLPLLNCLDCGSPAINTTAARSVGTPYIIDGTDIASHVKLSCGANDAFTKILYDSYPKADIDNPDSHILTREQIDHMPTMQINDLLTIFPGVYQVQRGGGISVFGSRIGTNNYIR
jgi:hypothetical protein